MTPIRTLRPLAKVVLSTQSDERLVALSRDGSEDAFAEIVRRHRPGLLRLARSLGSGDRADDVVQDGLVRAWRALQRSDAEIDLRPWLATIVRNRALTAHSTNRIHEELDETIDGVRQPGDIVIMREELRSAVSAVNALPDSQREALVRSALAGESHDQIASALATSPGAVRQLIFRARTGLREAVGAVIPFPLVRALADIGTGGAMVGVGAGAAVATGGGAAIGIKALAVVAVGAVVAGSGVAIQSRSNDDAPKESPQTTANAQSVTPTDRARPIAENTGDGATDTQATTTEAVTTTTLKNSGANRSLALTTSDSREGSPRVDSDPVATDPEGESDQTSSAPTGDTQPGGQQPPAEPKPDPQPSGHDGPRDGGRHQQQQPPPPPQQQPGTSDQPADDGHDGDGRHHGPGDYGDQPAPANAHDGGYADELGDLLP